MKRKLILILALVVVLSGCLVEPSTRTRVWEVDCSGRALRDTVIDGQRVAVIDSCRITPAEKGTP